MDDSAVNIIYVAPNLARKRAKDSRKWKTDRLTFQT